MRGDFSFLNVAELNARLISLLILAGQHGVYDGTNRTGTSLNDCSTDRNSSISNRKNGASGFKEKKNEQRQTKKTRFKEPKTHDLIGPGNTETDAAAPDRSGEPEAERGSQEQWNEAPGTAPHHPPGTIP